MDFNSQIRILCPCRTKLPPGKMEILTDTLKPLGFVLDFVECESLTACLNEHQEAENRFFQRSPYAVTMPIISQGDGIDDSDKFHPFPNVESGFDQNLRNKRLFIFLVEEQISESVQKLIKAQKIKPEPIIVSYDQFSIGNCFKDLIPALGDVNQQLASDPGLYCFPEFVSDGLNYESVEKRVYVWANGYGTVEINYSILEENAEPVANAKGEFSFHHRISVLPDAKKLSKSKFQDKLRKIEKTSLRELFKQPPESFAVLPFGQPAPKVKALYSKVTDGQPESKEVAVQVTPPKRRGKSQAERLISYGIIWSSENLFTVMADSTVLTCKHSFERVSFSVCFMRSTLEHGWQFQTGPMLRTYGPFMNHLGTNDSVGLGDEHFHYLYFPWPERRVSVGTALEISWELSKPPKESRK